MHLYLYADDESIEILGAQRPKALLIGGDFGYGNFGDVLQHKGAISRVKAASGLAAVSILTLDAISRYVDIGALRKGYGADALAFVSERPIASETAAQLQLREVAILCNVSYIQLYGGGFLNEMWGDFVLGVAEHFLERLPGAAYVISGQQISQAYAPRVRDHVARFKPQMMAVRDRNSVDLMADQGMRVDFSFDDAVEPLLELRHKLNLQAGKGAFLHLNTSGYTGNDGAMDEMVAHLRLVSDRIGSEKPTLLHAFQDAREEVVDSIETVKRLESAFPFTDVETVMLVAAIMESGHPGDMRVLTGRFGYSSSYHVTLWLQLAGIPCWLRGSNEYYRQKRAALGIEGEVEDFLERMHCPDHGENLHARSLWLDKLKQVMESVEPATNRIEWELPADGVPTREFHFKGEPRFELQMRETWKAYEDGQHEIRRLGTALEDANARLTAAESAAVANHSEKDILLARLEAHTSERASLLSRIEATAEERGELKVQLLGAESRASELGQMLADRQQRVMEQDRLLEEVRASLHVCSEQLAVSESDARRHRDDYARTHAELQEALASAHELSERLQACNEQLTVVGDGDDARHYREECAQVHTGLQEALARESELSERLRACNEQLTVMGDDARHYREECAQAHAGLQRALARESELSERLLACNEQLTMVGHDAHYYRDEYNSTHASLQDVSARERELSAQLQAILRSRSWRWTRLLRAGNRFMRTGRFDPAGRVGLFGAAQIVGRKLPVPGTLRSALGRLLMRWRRR